MSTRDRLYRYVWYINGKRFKSDNYPLPSHSGTDSVIESQLLSAVADNPNRIINIKGETTLVNFAIAEMVRVELEPLDFRPVV